MNINGNENKNPIYNIVNINKWNDNNKNIKENNNFSNANNNNNNNFINNTMNMNNININSNLFNNMNNKMNNCINNTGINNMNNNPMNNCINNMGINNMNNFNNNNNNFNNNGLKNGINFNNFMMNNQKNFCNLLNNFPNCNNNNNINLGMINNNNSFNNNVNNNLDCTTNFNNNMNCTTNFNNNLNCPNFNNNLDCTTNFNNNLNCTTNFNNNINNNFSNINMNFPNNMNIMQNNLNFNNLNQTQSNFNNNQLCTFNNPQLQNNWLNNTGMLNMFNPYNFNYKNNYFQQSMQNMLFQQMFYKFMLQQYIFNYLANQNLYQNYLLNTKKQPSFPKLENVFENQPEIAQNNELYQDLLEILREPNIQAKNDKEIIEQFSAPELMSNNLTTEIITEFLNLDPNLLNGFGNKLKGNWATNEMRGGLNYNPPIGWVGFGLNVINKYDNGNNDWLACDGRPGEWCVGYHGTGRNKSSEQVKNIIKSILINNLQPGGGQGYRNDFDANNPNNKVGRGVYCSPDINVLEEYAGCITVKGKKYKVGIMVRCKRDKIRIPQSHQNYWVLDGNFDQLRPYRLLIKQQ